ncbi:hypothetical protein Lal_00046661 [Lupinus albus]|nr:hypothetical protein Lal_00048016 [Lupinus albus]KAF1856278.1 hypothetical protein Lal_00046661 [Lupinus albus]
MPDRHLDQRDEGIKIFDLDLEEQAKNLLHAKCVMVPDKLTTRCPHFSVGPARTGTRTTWIRRGLFLTRSNFPHGHGKTHQHAWESLLGRWEGAPWHAILTHQAGEHFIIPENWKISVGHGSAPYHAFTEIGNAPRTHVPIVDLAPTNRTQPSFGFIHKHTQPWLNNSKLASKFGAIFMKGSAPYHAFTEIGNAPRTHVPIVDLAPTNRTQPSFGFIHKHTQPWLNNSKLASKFGAIFMKGSAPYHAFTEIGNAPRTHVPIVDLAPTNRTQPSFGFIHKHTQPWLNNSKLASKFGAIFMKGSAPYHAFTEIGNASEAKKTHTRHGTCPWATFAFT